jgi:hypothetical protein
VHIPQLDGSFQTPLLSCGPLWPRTIRIWWPRLMSVFPRETPEGEACPFALLPVSVCERLAASRRDAVARRRAKLLRSRGATPVHPQLRCAGIHDSAGRGARVGADVSAERVLARLLSRPLRRLPERSRPERGAELRATGTFPNACPGAFFRRRSLAGCVRPRLRVR